MRWFKACLSGAVTVLLAVTAVRADFVDLTTSGSSGTINGAVFLEDAAQPAGVGVFQPFLRLQDSPTEQGLNTDATPVPYDDKNSANWTHSVLLSDVGVVNSQGIAYRAFGLDINQSDSGGNPILNLTQLQLFTASQPDLTSVSQLGTPLYDLNAGGGNNAVILNSGINPGLGHSNMIALVPNSDFVNPTGTYLYLYSTFTNSNGGFEQWNYAAATDPPTVPEPASFVITALGLIGFAGIRLVRRAQQRIPA